MNIFSLDNDPKVCATMHCDKHMKMVLESAQLLSTAHRVLDGPEFKDDRKFLYKVTHVNHPCALWTRQSNNNYTWLYCLYRELCNEFFYRRGKHHASSALDSLLFRVPCNTPIGPLTPHPLCMPDEYKVDNDPVKSYRNYYRFGKSDIVSWKWGREEPEFMRSEL